MCGIIKVSYDRKLRRLAQKPWKWAPDPSTQKYVGRGVHTFGHTVFSLIQSSPDNIMYSISKAVLYIRKVSIDIIGSCKTLITLKVKKKKSVQVEETAFFNHWERRDNQHKLEDGHN